MFIGKYNKSVILTYIGVALAVMGIYFSFTQNIPYAMLCLAISGVCDLFDGMVARHCKRTEEEKLFGVEIDSLADMMGFVALPIALCCGIGLTKWYNVVIYIVYTLAAISRLGYFNIAIKESGTESPVKYYTGLPVTFAALIFTTFWFFSFILKASTFAAIYSLLMLIMALLYILKIRVPKPRGVAYIILGLAAIVVCCAIMLVG
ncbi:CDP-alcohol phosphatidyltransferase family protein [Pseudobacteroides cellulosolvens]|uniref:CDP-alcohol phosphatidyltransferase n=1 Tax=Pseudobacteroides cellulosolvens ATCC 35603 = DSM 2933 TaxID=398512 RepID=A0A0L6JR68_9FIRM|nr:CDP-alcohol phosphatidyltransferase family protein [Pseudobacteroides cellulosolvens]KNY27877.1 CDP-alcohol phosphatidyltransferase [Pseudobacteroides cellulosolvens ATCC 35603 = DSM 2933]